MDSLAEIATAYHPSDDGPALADAETDESPAILIEDRWELTWPIWHMLPRAERKSLAVKHGYKTIGEFEEYMTLQRAVDTSTPYENSLVYPDYHEEEQPTAHVPREDQKHKKAEEDDEDSVDEKLEAAIESERLAVAERLSQSELEALGGQILMLPDEMLHRVFAWLPVDVYATLALVSPHWRSFTRTEAVYRRLCERLYLNQSKRRALHVHRFNNSYRTMLEKRPRVRAGGGVYVLKYAKVKPIQRDMWTEVPIGAVLETIYYRYLYFQEDGRVLYALTTAPPHEMFPRFRKVCLSKEPDKAAVWGTFTVAGRIVTVEAEQSWQHVRLQLSILPNNLHGRYGMLSFDGHVTSSKGRFDDPWDRSRVVFEVPEEPFRFVKDRRL